jgi:hypothetical protein
MGMAFPLLGIPGDGCDPRRRDTIIDGASHAPE